MILAYISGENRALAIEEICALAERKGWRVFEAERRAVVCEGKKNFFKRLALSHWIADFVGKVSYENLCQDLEETHLFEKLGGKRIFVRCFRGSVFGKSLEIAKKIADCLPQKAALPPDVWIYGILEKQSIYLGLDPIETDRKSLPERDAKKRPFFHPASMNAILARALVNLSGVLPGENLLDPFCGAGGILIEAGIIGARIFGVDKDPKMVLGCLNNLNYYGIDGGIILGDARSLPFRDAFFDAVATDLPYGKSTKVFGELNDLYRASISEIFRVLKPERKAVIVCNRNISEILKEAGFESVKVFEWLIHKRLKRFIHVGVKP